MRNLTYTYDNAGKLTSETGTDGKGVAYQNLWSYDAVGNRVGATKNTASVAGVATWAHTTQVQSAFNANDQLTTSSSSVDGGTAVTQTTRMMSMAPKPEPLRLRALRLTGGTSRASSP